LNLFEKLLEETGSGYLVGKDITFVDIQLWDTLEGHNEVYPAAFDAFPRLQNLRKLVASRPNISNYIQKHRRKSDWEKK
jgi:glutathione S-transferase